MDVSLFTRRPREGRRRGTRVAALATAAALVGGLLAGVAPAQAAEVAPAAVSHPGDSDVNGYRNVGYFTQWGVYGRNFQLKKVQDS
ncbi:MAG: chitinase, partial [Cellulosimicrobium sp.]|nr:chitinase [Cellulosimicrobium sp.]